MMRVYLHEGDARTGKWARQYAGAMRRGKQVNAEKVDPAYQELLVKARFDLGQPEPDMVLHVTFDQLLNRVAGLPARQLGRTVAIPPAAKRSDGTALGDLDMLEELKDAKDGFRRVFEIAKQNAQRAKDNLPLIPLNLHQVFEGNRGTGKTTVVKLYARMLKELGLMAGDEVAETKISSIIRKTGSDQAKIKTELEAYKGKVLVVEGLDALNSDPSNFSDYANAKLVAEQLADMAAANELVVVLSGDAAQVKHGLAAEGIKRFAPTKVAFPDYKNATLGRILGKMAFDQKYEVDEKEVAQIAKIVGGDRGASFTNANAVRDALNQAIARRASRLSKNGRTPDMKALQRLELRDFMPEKPTANGPDSAAAKLQSMIGLEKIKKQFGALENLIKANEQQVKKGKTPILPNLNAIFTGNPGTGKTTVARLYARFLAERGFAPKGHVVEVTAKEILGNTVGSAATNLRAKMAEAKGGVLFIDEAYAFFDKNGVGYGKDALDTLVGLINPEGAGDTIVVMAGYKHEMEEMVQKSNPGLKRRFAQNFEFEDYTVEQLGKIMQGKAKDKGVKIGADAQFAAMNELARLKKTSNFGNGGVVENMINQGFVNMANRLANSKGKKASSELLAQDLVPKPVRAGEALKTLNKMSGLESVKQTFRQLEALVEQNEKREQDGLEPQVPNLNAVFDGNPGTGKTTVAKLYGQFLKEKGFLSNGEVIEVKPQEIIGGAIGQTEKNVQELLERARGKVLFIDEAYQFHDKGIQGGGYGRKAIDALVAAINADGNQDFAVIMAGYKTEMDEMFRNTNPGLRRRFRQSFHFDDYGDEDLAKIMEKKVGDKKYTIAKEVVQAAVAHLGRKRALPNFGNAGEVENMINDALPRQAERLARMNDAKKEDRMRLSMEDLLPAPPKPAEAAQVLHDLVGQDHIKAKIEEYEAIIADAKNRGKDPRNYFEPYFLFTGNPGTGKTTVAKRMGKIFHNLGFLPSDEVIVKDAAELLAGYQGQTTALVEDIFKSAMGKTLFIDEAYKLADPRNSYAKEAVERLLNLMTEHRGKVAIILAGYGEQMEVLMDVNPGLKSRFSEQLKFKDLDHGGAKTNFLRLLKGEEMTLAHGAEAALDNAIEQMMSKPGWANYRDLETFQTKVQRKRAVRVVRATGANPSEVTKSDLDEALVDFLTSKRTEREARAFAEKEQLEKLHRAPQAANATHEAPTVKHEVVHEHVEARADHAHGNEGHDHAHDAKNIVTQHYSAQEQHSIDALSDVMGSLDADQHTKDELNGGGYPKSVVAAMKAKLKLNSEHEAREAIRQAQEAMRRAELAIQAEIARLAALPKPARVKQYTEIICQACGRAGHDYRPMEFTYELNEDTGERRLVGQRKVPGTGW